jgi:hypothetical protein
VTVNVSTYRRLQVTPGTNVHAGTTLYVKAIGACAKPFAADYGATLEFTNHQVDESKYVQIYGKTAMDAQGYWSGHVAVPVNTPPGPYEIDAYCGGYRYYSTWYPTVPITVLPAG